MRDQGLIEQHRSFHSHIFQLLTNSGSSQGTKEFDSSGLEELVTFCMIVFLRGKKKRKKKKTKKINVILNFRLKVSLLSFFHLQGKEVRMLRNALMFNTTCILNT